MNRTTNSGFTLIELMIVLVVMTAITAVAVPQFSRGMTYVELRRNTQELAASLRQARNRSITESQVAELTFDAERQLVRASGIGIVFDWPESVHVELAGDAAGNRANEWSIRFYPDGSATDTVLTVSALNRRYEISVDWLTGRVRVI